MKRVLILILTCSVILFAAYAWASVAAEDLPIIPPAKKLDDSLSLGLAPILTRIALVVGVFIVMLSRSFGALLGVGAVIIGGIIASKGTAFLTFFGISGSLF